MNQGLVYIERRSREIFEKTRSYINTMKDAADVVADIKKTEQGETWDGIDRRTVGER